ncbi:MAG TPA: pilin [Cyanothece sp. UBA12306]|nr:pilin [Cyanothece sp. UBA12306]
MMEVSITAVIAGILAATAVPNLIGMLQGNKVQKGLEQVENSLRDAQKQAMRMGERCDLKLDKTAKPPTITPSPVGCLVGTDRDLPNGVAIDLSKGNTISFSFKGTTTTSTTIIVKSQDGKGKQKCVSISNGIGIMRSGTYDDTRSKDKCYRST